MSISENKIKEEITKRWDYSSQRYDTYHGHGIKTEEETAAWTAFFRQVLPGERLNILDIGCGTGEISLVLAGMGHKVTGIDLSEKMLDRAKEKSRALAGRHGELAVDFRIGDAESLTFEPGSFDAVVTRHVLWTLPNPQKAVDSWTKMLKDGGKVVVIDCLWNDGSLETRLRMAAFILLMRIVERNDLSKDRYTPEINAALPNSRGLRPDTARSYLEKAGLKDVGLIRLDDLVDIQKRHMPFRYKISYKLNYYAVHGKKELYH